MEWYEAAFDRYYPILYSHRDEGEVGRALDSFERYFGGRSPILDLASGEGRYLESLVLRGFDAFGLDLSGYLLERSVRQRGQGGRVVQGDMRHLPFRDGVFGGVINMFTSFGYFSADTDNLLVLREVQRVLTDGGVFLFDFINSERIVSSLLDASERESEGFRIREKRRITEYGKYLVKEVDMYNAESGEGGQFEERLRLYTHDDLMKMFHSVDMKVTDVFGDYDGNAYQRGVSDRVIVVATKGN
jgi:SAM-dependent methyltransferase